MFRILKVFFKKVFHSSNPNLADIHDVLKDVHPIISDELNLSLVAIPTTKEIYSTTKEMEPWNSPGPGGFPACFFRDNWDIVSLQVIENIQNFFKTKCLLHHLNYTFISLIPKVSNHSTANDFRPICLANSVIISKILTNRLKPLLNSIISLFQSAFVSNRQIQDNIIISHEILHSFKRIKKGKEWLYGY